MKDIKVFLGDEMAIGKKPELVTAWAREYERRNVHTEVADLQPILNFDRR